MALSHTLLILTLISAIWGCRAAEPGNPDATFEVQEVAQTLALTTRLSIITGSTDLLVREYEATFMPTKAGSPYILPSTHNLTFNANAMTIGSDRSLATYSYGYVAGVLIQTSNYTSASFVWTTDDGTTFSNTFDTSTIAGTTLAAEPKDLGRDADVTLDFTAPYVATTSQVKVYYYQYNTILADYEYIELTGLTITPGDGTLTVVFPVASLSQLPGTYYDLRVVTQNTFDLTAPTAAGGGFDHTIEYPVTMTFTAKAS